MRKRSALLLCGVIFTGKLLCSQPIVELTLQGDPGDWITLGQNWSVVYDNASDQIQAAAFENGLFGLTVDTFGQLPLGLIISLGGFGTPVTVGQYHSPGTGLISDPFFSFSFDHRGDSDTEADFSVNAIETATPPDVPYYQIVAYPLEYLDVSFTQETRTGIPEFSGRIIFDANPVPEPSSFGFVLVALFAGSLCVFLAWSKSGYLRRSVTRD